MGSPISFGSRSFKADGKKVKLPQPEASRQGMRWTNANGSSPLLISLAAYESVAILPNFNSISNLILIKKVIAWVLFTDSSTGAVYNLGEAGWWRISNTDLVNVDTQSDFKFYKTNQSEDLDITAQLTAARQINMDYSLSGGDVLAATGVTPGAGDTFEARLSVGYIPL